MRRPEQSISRNEKYAETETSQGSRMAHPSRAPEPERDTARLNEMVRRRNQDTLAVGYGLNNAVAASLFRPGFAQDRLQHRVAALVLPARDALAVHENGRQALNAHLPTGVHIFGHGG